MVEDCLRWACCLTLLILVASGNTIAQRATLILVAVSVEIQNSLRFFRSRRRVAIKEAFEKNGFSFRLVDEEIE